MRNKPPRLLSRRLAVCALAAVMLLAPARASAVKYIFAFISGSGSGQNGQLKSIFEDVLKNASSRIGADIETRPFKDSAAVGRALSSKSDAPSIALPLSHSEFYVMSKKYGFRPLATYSMYGKSKVEFCFFVKEGSSAKKPADLKGKTVATYYEEFNYYILRDAAGAPPEKYFRLSPIPDGSSGIYALALDKAAAAYVSDYIVEYLKMTNPGAVKGLRKFSCSPGFTQPPAMVSKNFSAPLSASIVDMLTKASTDPAFKKYKQLLTMTKLKFQSASIADYSAHIKIFETAAKKGWNKDYEKWRAQIAGDDLAR